MVLKKRQKPSVNCKQENPKQGKKQIFARKALVLAKQMNVEDGVRKEGNKNAQYA